MGLEHGPEVRAAALQRVEVPSQTVTPRCSQPPDPGEVHAVPMVRHTPPQLAWPVGHAHCPEALQTPPLSPVQLPEVRGAASQRVAVPTQVMVPGCSQPPLPVDTHEAPTG